MKQKHTVLTENSVEKQIGLRLSALRIERGFSLEEIDELLGMKKGTTEDFEEGNHFVSPSHLYELSRVLEVDVSSLFPEMKAPKEPLAPAPEDVADALRLLKAYYDIEDPGVRRSVMDLLREVGDDESFSGT